ncbi:MAG: acyl-CoA dehydratase activase [Caldisericia bacterium]|jgi:predicted CoA-substrate-specific enzyme activase|nr:acyl-CoA dehydratase activase [Caldisericia bacterium]
MNYYIGVDIGSVSTKVVLLRKGGEINIVNYKISPTGANGNKTAKILLEEILKEENLKIKDIYKILATGYGRVNVDFTDLTKTEISCHAKGAFFLFPKTKTIIDIGGQDSKAIKLANNGSVLDFVMNDKCAAGTGRFLEVMSNALQIDLKEFGSLHEKSKNLIEISSICTVFAESEIISLIHEGVKKEDIIKGLNYSVAKRALTLLKRVNYEEEITMTGGVAKNLGVVKALEDLLKVKLNVPENPQIIGAIGAALYAIES